MNKILAITLSFYAALIIERALVHYPRASMNMDSLFYTLSAIRFSEGNFAETLSGPWQPLTGWVAGVLVFLGLSATTAVSLLCVAGGAVALVCVHRLLTGALSQLGGAIAALVAGVGLASDPRFLKEVVAIRSDGFHLGFALLVFSMLYHHVVQREKATWKSYAAYTILGCSLVALRVAALPMVCLTTILVIAAIRSDRRTRVGGSIVYCVAVTSVVLAFCFFYYHRFRLFIPSLNFAFNKFLLVAEWTHSDPEAFCRLFDGSNTFLSDVQFLDPSVSNLPSASDISEEVFRKHRRNNFLNFFLIGFRLLPPLVWLAVLAGFWTLWKQKEYRAVGFGLIWATFASGAQVLSIVQYRFFLPVMPLLYLLAGIGAARYLKKRAQWFCVVIAIINVWTGRSDMNPGFLLSGTFLNSPELVGDAIYQRHGPGKMIMANANYPSLIAAKARWKTIPCIETKRIIHYMREKKIDFLILTKPVEDHYGATIRNLLTEPGFLELEVATDAEAAYRVLR